MEAAPARLALSRGRQLARTLRAGLLTQPRRRAKCRASSPPAAFPISNQWPRIGGFESITVAGPRGNLTRFPILPD